MSAGRVAFGFSVVLVTCLATMSIACRDATVVLPTAPTDRPVSPPIGPISPPTGGGVLAPAGSSLTNSSASSINAGSGASRNLVAFLMEPIGGTTTHAFFAILMAGAIVGFMRVLGPPGDN